MKKAIILVRTSTVKQEIESQTNETIEYAKTLGYEEFAVVGSKGASAVKVDEQYKRNMAKVKELVYSGEYDAVVSWHLTRVGRDEIELYSFKKFLVDNKIQLYIKEPSLFLLNPDGTVNSGMELALALHITLAKQSAEELKAKSKRAKQRDKAIGKWTGGSHPLFGYYRDENNFLHIDEEKSRIVIEIFQMYATSQYSYGSLAKHINERYGMNVSGQWIKQKITNETYYNGNVYQPIVSKELFDKANDVKVKRKTEYWQPMSYKRHTFANRILRCQCGRGYTVTTSGSHLMYRCSECHEGECVRVSNMDGLLWPVASHLESERLLNGDWQKEYKEKQAELGDKIKSMGKYKAKAEKARQRAKECVLEGIITMEEYKARIAKIDEESVEVEQKVAMWTEEIGEIGKLIEADKSRMDKVRSISQKITESDEAEMCAIVRRWVRKVTIVDHVVTIETLGRVYKAVYYPQSNVRRWATVNGRTLAILPIERSSEGCSIASKGKFKFDDIPGTIAWLSGSVIV